MKETISEFKRTCNECGKVWHVLQSREQQLKKDLKSNNCSEITSAIGMCGGDNQFQAMSVNTQAKRNQHALTNEITRLKECPNCQSGNYNEVSIVYSKR